MEKNWYARLLEVIEADPRSYKRLSEDIGHGQNYVQQMITNKKEPGSDKLAKLLDALGQDAALYVMTGVRANAQTIEYLNLLAVAPVDLRQSTLDLLSKLGREMQGQREDDQEQFPAEQGQDQPTT
ncbi:helix-turn-helix domain-containing protein [Paracoccus sp. pheM1]|uniref:helix-turn-helix domain-containing protein n=1 Tax=Paracoccus sp. pheM1 TaxID=2831675 RepID=UPI001BDB8F8C|nr:helix-turn-helix domain-containing protein [Paracoccus sp. pheM1]MBT0779574.1 helix-turn-helix domain-containing protein [Paracoccus sp. pheM1]